MNSEYKEIIAILRQCTKEESSLSNNKVKKISLQECQTLQYQEHLKALEPVVYKKQKKHPA